jgi:hypothetical protein
MKAQHAEDGDDNVLTLGGRQARVVEDIAQLGIVLVEHSGKGIEVGTELVDAALLATERQEGAGIAAGKRAISHCRLRCCSGQC